MEGKEDAERAAVPGPCWGEGQCIASGDGRGWGCEWGALLLHFLQLKELGLFMIRNSPIFNILKR